jgi:hypothetical protein
MSRSERIFRFLLRAYPPSTRDAFGEDMAQLFADQLRDAPNDGERAAVWARAIADTLLDAPRERATGRRSRRVAEGPTLVATRPLGPDLLAAAAPLLLAATLLLVAPGFLAPLFDERAQLVGVPMGITLTVAFALLADLGILALRRGGLRDGRTRLLAAAMLAVPIPALLFLYGLEAAFWYAVAAAVLLAVVSVRWLSFALAVPFVLWLLLGPAVVLALIESLGPAVD